MYKIKKLMQTFSWKQTFVMVTLLYQLGGATSTEKGKGEKEKGAKGPKREKYWQNTLLQGVWKQHLPYAFKHPIRVKHPDLLILDWIKRELIQQEYVARGFLELSHRHIDLILIYRTQAQ